MSEASRFASVTSSLRRRDFRDRKIGMDPRS